MAAAVTPLVAFDDSGENVAYYGPEGSLKIWEIITGSLEQEYVPSSHLSSVCTCLSWMPSQITEIHKNKKKKRKSEIDPVREKIVAMGTLKGNILLYSVSIGNLDKQLCDGHVDSVSDIQWRLNKKELFSSSHDGHIIQWDLKKGKPKSKWRADKVSVNRIVLSTDGETLVSAGKTIKWWHIENKQTLKEFAGHATQIVHLKLISFPDEDGYVVSAAAEDRTLSVWSLKSSSRNALATCILSEDPAMFDVYAPASRAEKVEIGSVTKLGRLQLFELQLNGKRSPPQEPRATLQITDEKSRSIRIVSCILEAGANVTFAYDNKLKLCCEKMELRKLKKDVNLVRAATFTSDDTTHSKLKIRSPDTKSVNKLLATSGCTPSLPTQHLEAAKSTKRKSSKGIELDGLPMDKRLGALRLDTISVDLSSVSTESVAHLLIQGLRSEDKKILDQVFSCRKIQFIEKTIKRLPIEVILPLIIELQHQIYKRWNASHLLEWIKIILITHTSYLSTCSELHSFLNPIYQLMDGRINLYKKMCHLKGKMDLLVSRLEYHEETSEKDKPALFNIQDESSEDEQTDIEEGLDNDELLDDMDYLSEVNGEDGEGEESGMDEDGTNSDSS